MLFEDEKLPQVLVMVRENADITSSLKIVYTRLIGGGNSSPTEAQDKEAQAVYWPDEESPVQMPAIHFRQNLVPWNTKAPHKLARAGVDENDSIPAAPYLI